MSYRLLPTSRRCLPWLLLLWLAVFGWTRASGFPTGEGEPFVQYFSPRDYHGGTQCMCVTQDRRGVMYIGSFGLVLEYDGSAWRKIDVDSNFVAGIDYEARTDTVFVGAQNNLGYLKLLPGGERLFVSLLDQLPADGRDVGNVDRVHVTTEGVFFVGTNRVMRWRDGRFQTWKLATDTRLGSDWVAGQLYVYSPAVGLLRLENDAFAPASDDPLFHRATVRSILAAPDGALLVGTLQDGLWTLRDGKVRPAEVDCVDFLKKKGIVGLLRLHDGSLAVATRSSGLLILDSANRFRSHLDQTGGLHGGNLLDLFEDREGGLWIGLQSGVGRAEVNSPLSLLRAQADDDLSSAYTANRWFGTWVLGTRNGLYRVVPADPATAVSAHLERMPGYTPAVRRCCAVENGLLIVADGRIMLLDREARLVPVADEITEACAVARSRLHPDRVYATDLGGRIHALRLDAGTHRWVNEGIVAELGEMGGEFALQESPRGDLWVESREHGLFRVQFAPGGPPTVTSYLDRPGPFQHARHVTLCGSAGPLRFSSAYMLGGLDGSGQEMRALKEFGERFCDGSFYLAEAVSYGEDSIWLTATDVREPTGDGIRGRVSAGRDGRAPIFKPLPRKIEEAVGRPGIFYPLDEPPGPLKTLLLVGTTGTGVAQMDVERWDTEPPPPPLVTLIRRACTLNGAATAAARPPPILGDPLPYARNSAHFEFAAATLAFGAAPRFQTRLANFGAEEWSDWSDRTSVDYLNLPEGRYTFEVRARNADGQRGAVASLPFRVLPPWQRTPWAFMLYILALAVVLAAIIRWRGRQLHRRNAALETLVEARTRELRGRETDLVRARDDAESANRAKSAFLANMSHELRTPLNAVLGYAQLLLKQTDLTPRSRERITVIGQSGGHLLSLVNEVLDLSKVEAGKLVLSQCDFSLSGLLDEVGAVFRPRLHEKGLKFTEDRAAGVPSTVRTDPSRLRQVLFNLLGNAVKFTQRGGVTLSVRPTNAGQVRFEVADTGVGIESKDQRDIFLAFHQVGDNSLASQGTGLGLTISRRLVELLGGRIELESAPGQGSRFWFDLPLTAVRSPDGSAPPVAQDSAFGKVTGYEGATRRLLLADDVTENRRVLRDFLQPLGFEVEETADGAGCLAACARQPPDAVLLDLRLGTPDGFEVARKLRARMNGARPGIIAISASVFESDRQQAIDAGCDDFLPKPFEEAQLVTSLGRVLGLRWAQETPGTAPEPSAVEVSPAAETTLPTEEIDFLRELSLRGDVAGIRRRLDAWREAGAPGHAGGVARRLESLAAAYDMEGIDDLLLNLQSHGRD